MWLPISQFMHAGASLHVALSDPERMAFWSSSARTFADVIYVVFIQSLADPVSVSPPCLHLGASTQARCDSCLDMHLYMIHSKTYAVLWGLC